jgi:autotransporter-associated beta strand protein
VAINRGYSAPNGGAIDTESNLTLSGVALGGSGTFNKTGPGQLAYTAVTSSNVLCSPTVAGSTYLIKAGTVLLDGSAGPQTNYARNLNLGSDAGVNATIILTNTTLSTRLTLGNNANCTGTMILNSNAFLKVLGGGGNFVVGGQSANASSPTAGVLIQNAGSTVDSDAELWVAQGPAATGVYTMNGGTTIFRNWVAIGRNGGPSATFNMTGGTITKTPNNNFMIGSRDGTSGTVGTLNQSGGTILVGSEYWIGEAQNNASAAIGTNNISGTATLIVSNWIAIGREGAIGVLNLSGGSVTKLGNSGNNIEIGNGTGSQGIINQTGGAFNNTISETRLGTGAPGLWNMSGGTANLAALVFCLNSGCTNGTFNLNGGILTATEIRANQQGAANVSTLNLNGGTIAAGPGANANFLHNLTAANVQSGGAQFDSSTNTININQSLLDGTGGGGLTKIGNGTLNLNGTNTYTGSTLVSTGALGGTGIIAGPVKVATGARLAPGGSSIGALTINNSLTFSNASSAFFRISNAGATTNNDQVSGLTAVTYNGSLVVSNAGGSSLVVGSVFKLFNAAGAGSGNFSSVTVLPSGSGTFNPATGELTITSTGSMKLNPPTVLNGNLVVTGTGNPGTGYTLLSSTNLTLPLAQWTTNSTGVFGGSGTSSNAIPIDSTNRFFLLRQP